jgi:signal transduction histidine kinase
VNKSIIDPLAMSLHEIRAPLGLVTMAASAALEVTENDQVRHQCLAIMHVTNRMMRVISNLYALAAPCDQPIGQTFVPEQVVREVCGDISALGVQLVLDTQEIGPGSVARGSSVQFEGLLQSLLMNALDHGCPGEPIAVRAIPYPGSLKVTITNELSGSARHMGVGLGNLIADRLAVALSCEVERSATSTSYQVTLTLPVHQRPSASAHSQPHELWQACGGPILSVPASAGDGR